MQKRRAQETDKQSADDQRFFLYFGRLRSLITASFAIKTNLSKQKARLIFSRARFLLFTVYITEL